MKHEGGASDIGVVDNVLHDVGDQFTLRHSGGDWSTYMPAFRSVESYDGYLSLQDGGRLSCP